MIYDKLLFRFLGLVAWLIAILTMDTFSICHDITTITVGQSRDDNGYLSTTNDCSLTFITNEMGELKLL